MDLHFNLLEGVSEIPNKKSVKNVWINLWGVEHITTERLQHMANICIKYKDASKLLVNTNEKLREQLRVFSLTHSAQFVDGRNDDK